MRFEERVLGDLIVNFDKRRIPLSSRQRSLRKGIYPYYGATSIMDYVDDYIFEGQYILMGEDGTVLDENGHPILQKAEGKFWCNNHAHVIRNTELITFNYLYYLLKNTNVRPIVTGAVQPKISQSNMNNLRVTIHKNIHEQRKVASILTVLDDRIANNTAINKNLEEQAQAIFKSWFVDFEPFGGEMPSDWKYGTLEDIADFFNGYAFKSKELLNKPMPNCYQVFKQGHINRGGGFNSSGTKSWYPIEKSVKLHRYILRRGDVLIAMTDMKDNVAILGNTALMPIDNQFIVNQRVGLLRSNGYKGTSYAYIYLLTNNFDFVTDLRKRANSGVQVNLSSSAIKESPILIANESVNQKFNNVVEPMLLCTMFNDIENQHLAALRDTLLPRLMSGEIDVSSIEL